MLPLAQYPCRQSPIFGGRGSLPLQKLLGGFCPPMPPFLCLCTATCTHVNLHLAIQPIVEEEVVGHPDTMGLHGVPLAIVVITNITCRVGTYRSKMMIRVLSSGGGGAGGSFPPKHPNFSPKHSIFPPC